uniref:8-oxo-dGTP diphosphatase n=1 Tax=viral metagenome TaxID=1070528 RepID=A0A6C0FC53_9ZZZZ|tara:strand:- start:6980 stop:7348 length:369 start_codon:yes stop_codon:yes gene_type:complete
MKVACGIMFDNANKILMGLRSDKGQNPNFWEFPGGKCEANETLEDCLHREWMEELNLKIKIEKLLHVSKSEDIECYFFIGKILDLGNLHVNVHQYVSFYDIEQLNQIRLFEDDRNIIPLLKN